MILRDINGKLNIISKKTCKNNISYYNKIYNIKSECKNSNLINTKYANKTNSEIIIEDLTKSI
jgi:hypothetical protein